MSTSSKFVSSIEGYAILEKEVRITGNSGRIYLPREWVGKRVKVVLIDPLTSSEIEV